MAPVKMLWGPGVLGVTNVTGAALSTTTLNDADNAIGWCFNVPRDGSITDIGFLVTARNGTPPSFNCGVVTQDSSGRPTTTVYGGSAITAYNVASTGWKWVTLSTPATASAGDYVAAHVYPGTAPDGSNNIVVCRDSFTGPGIALYYTTAWNVPTPPAGALMAIRYSDGYIFGNAFTSNTVHVQLRSDVTPDEAGCKFTMPAQMTVTGARFVIQTGWGVNATATVTLYSDAGATLATTSITNKNFADDTSTVDVFFDSVTLSAGSTYRVTVTANVSAASGVVVMQYYQFDSTDAKAAWPCGADWQYTSRADAGSWTDNSLGICPIALWVSNIDFSGGTVTSIFTGTPYSAEFPASNYPQLTLSNRRPVLAFDASTDETAYWTFIVPQGGVGTSLTCIITYAMASATSGSVYWQAQLEAITPGDATDTDAATSFDTANSGNGTVPGTAGYVGTVTITMTNADNIAAGDLVRLSVNRDADHGSDTATGDAYLLAVELRSA